MEERKENSYDKPFWNWRTTEEIPIPDKLIDQVIGQDEAVEIIKMAAKQKRNVLLIGDPGTGKSMLAQAMAELLPTEELEDILVFPNPEDKNNPKIKVTPAGEGKRIVEMFRRKAREAEERRKMLLLLLVSSILIFAFMSGQIINGIIAAALVALLILNIKTKEEIIVPKILVAHEKGERAPFVDATGAHAGALLGDVRHDPFQSGGLETPAHERVEPGAIHKAHRGVLYIDEIASLSPEMQVELLTAMQEKKKSITGQSEKSSGAMVKTDPVPCDFILVAAGNVDAIMKMHPALRSRIRGYGYEVYMRHSMPDTEENRFKIARFVAQEVRKDGRIPHFTREAVEEIIKEARRRAGRKGHLTLRLRELGGLIRAAGDIARAEGSKYVERRHVLMAKARARTLEQQIAERYVELRKEYQVLLTEGAEIGRVNGLALIGDSGIVLPIVAEVSPSHSKSGGRIIATGKLGEIAREAVENVSAIIKKYSGHDISNYDIHIQFLQAYEGVEGDSASISVATAVISALERIPVDQSVGMTGSLSVRGEVLPVGGVTQKVEAAIASGLRKVIIPKRNLDDLALDPWELERIEIIPVERIEEVLEHALVGERKRELIKRIRSIYGGKDDSESEYILSNREVQQQG